jgi:hypothetical protein
MGDDDLKLARRMVSSDTELGRWLARERDALCAALGREPTACEFVEHALGRFHADPRVRAMAVAAAREAEAAATEDESGACD